jgi:hypothetical protein
MFNQNINRENRNSTPINNHHSRLAPIGEIPYSTILYPKETIDARLDKESPAITGQPNRENKFLFISKR